MLTNIDSIDFNKMNLNTMSILLFLSNVCRNKESGKKWKLAQVRHGSVVLNHK